MSPKQSTILFEAQKAGKITIAKAVKLVGGNIYCNEAKHVGSILSNMVRRGMLVRVKPGLYRPAEKAVTIVVAKGWWED